MEQSIERFPYREFEPLRAVGPPLRTLPSTTSLCRFCPHIPRCPSACTERRPPRSTCLYEPVHIIFVARGGGTWARETKLDSTRPRATCVLEDCAREECALMACSECTQSTRGALGAFLQLLDMTSNRLAKSLSNDNPTWRSFAGGRHHGAFCQPAPRALIRR